MIKTKIKLSARKILIALTIFLIFVGIAGAMNCSIHVTEAEDYLNASDYGGASVTYDTIGMCYYNEKDYDAALLYFEKAAEYSLKADEYRAAGVAYDGIGLCYNARNNYDAALPYFKKAVEYSLKAKDYRMAGVAYDDIGMYYYNKTDYDAALPYFKKAAEYSLNAGDYRMASVAYDNVGLCYYNKDDCSTAVKYWNLEINVLKKEGLDFSSVKYNVEVCTQQNSTKSPVKPVEKTGKEIIKTETENQQPSETENNGGIPALWINAGIVIGVLVLILILLAFMLLKSKKHK